MDMEGFTRFADEKPPVLTDVLVMYAGRILKTQWGVVNEIYGETITAWELDPSGQIEIMWWKLP